MFLLDLHITHLKAQYVQKAISQKETLRRKASRVLLKGNGRNAACQLNMVLFAHPSDSAKSHVWVLVSTR